MSGKEDFRMHSQIKHFAQNDVMKEETAIHVLKTKEGVFGVTTRKNASCFQFTPVNISLGDVASGLIKQVKIRMCLK